MNIHQNLALVHGLLIAAGASRRLGQPKQLVKYKGQALINHVINQLEESNLNDLKVVLGSQSEEITRIINRELDLVINDQWETGMGSSIGAGVSAVDATIDGICIVLADQYYMTSDLIDLLIDRFRRAPDNLVISKYGNGIIGPPAIFPRRLRGSLQTLSGDRGAGKIIQSELSCNPNQVVIVDFENGHLDIDTPEDLLNLSI